MTAPQWLEQAQDMTVNPGNYLHDTTIGEQEKLIQNLAMKICELGAVKQKVRDHLTEFKKGCGCASPSNPEECPQCSAAVLRAIESEVAK